MLLTGELPQEKQDTSDKLSLDGGGEAETTTKQTLRAF